MVIQGSKVTMTRKPEFLGSLHQGNRRLNDIALDLSQLETARL